MYLFLLTVAFSKTVCYVPVLFLLLAHTRSDALTGILPYKLTMLQLLIFLMRSVNWMSLIKWNVGEPISSFDTLIHLAARGSLLLNSGRGFSGEHNFFVKPEIRLNPSPVNTKKF